MLQHLMFGLVDSRVEKKVGWEFWEFLYEACVGLTQKVLGFDDTALSPKLSSGKWDS